MYYLFRRKKYENAFFKDKYINSCNVVGISCTENTRILEEKGFITRNPANQGSKIIMESAITPSGMELYKKITDALDEHIKEANECLNIDVESVIRNLKLIRQSAMEKYNIKFN